MENKETLQNLIKVIDNFKNQDDWTDLALIGKPLNDLGVNYKAMGYMKLRELIEEFSENIEIKKDTSHEVPVYYAKVKKIQVGNLTIQTKRKQPTKGSAIQSNLLDWAYMGDFRHAINDLKNIALKERWYYKSQHPTYPFPILSKYLTYTFFRLSKEAHKIAMNDQFATFNTGLVNNLYEPIYALFEKNKVQGRQEWFFHEFCISGVGRAGKNLASNFNPLPDRAQFFNNTSELIYDINGPEPQMNWNHIILDNVSRLPIEFLEENKPTGFLFRDTTTMNTIEKNNYFKTLAEAIENDSKRFRAIKNRFADSLSLALKRVQWNFKTAIPMYYPPNNKMSLLLPLSLLDDEVIDLALVAEKTLSGSYLGHTIIPLSWAYSNARLITRPDSDWLIAEKIDTDTFGVLDEDETE